MTTLLGHHPDAIPDPTIRTPDQRLRVFVSSTLGELAPEREAVKSAIRTLRLTPVMFELGARPHPPRQLYRSYLAQSHVFVGVYWESYGWVAPDEDMSGIEDEYRLVGDRPALIYVKEPAPRRDPRLAAMLDRIRNDDRSSYRRFKSPGELAELVVEDLAVLMSERFEATQSLPTGTLTFLTTDVADARGLADELGDAYPPAIEAHRHVIDGIVTGLGGRLVDADRDTTLSVFGDAVVAVRAALEARRRVASETPSLDLRIGLHTGNAEVSGSTYTGIEVHRASRVGAAADRDQILLSATTARMVEPMADPNWTVHDLGSFALKGLAHTEHLFSLTAGDEQVRPPRARRAGATALPAQLTSLVGRDHDIDAVTGLLATPEVRLVTLTGPGGIGKSRLGLAVAERVAGQYPDGTFFVDLAPVSSPDDVLVAVADAAGIATEGAALDAVADALSHRRVLLVMDNFEHVVDAATSVAALLAYAPGVNVLATSRVVLRVNGEHEYPVEPLAVPETWHCSLDELAGSPAVTLFVERASAIRPGFTVTDDNAPAVAAITRLLDGVPLAIEIAAARLRVYSPTALAERLALSFDVMGEGAADLPDRQRTLRATIDWSHSLLTDEEQRVFRRLGVFRGGWTLEAAEAVAGDDEITDVTSVVASLIDKSLVRRQPTDEPRFRMLVTIGDYSRASLEASGECDEIQDRHVAWFCDLARMSAEPLIGPLQATTIARLSADWANIEAAAERLVDEGDCDALVSLLIGVWVFLWLDDHLAKARGWLEVACETGPTLEPTQMGRLQWLRGAIDYVRGAYDQAHTHSREALALLRTADDPHTLAWAEYIDVLILPALGVPADEIRTRLQSTIDGFVAVGDLWGEGYGLLTLGILAAADGDIEAATGYHRRTLELARRFRNDNLSAQAHTQLGITAWVGGDPSEAARHLREAADIFAPRNYREGIAYVYEGLAALHLTAGRPRLGMLALGCAEGIRRRLDLHPWPATAWFFQMLIATADSFEDPELQAARQVGAETDPFELVERVFEIESAEEVAV